METRAVTSSDIGWIAEIMCKSSPLVNDRQRVCMGLGLSMAQLTDIDRDRDRNAGTHGYLTMALNVWISNSFEATFEKLIQVLISQELNSTADELSRKQTEHPPISNTNLNQNFPSIWFDVPEDVHMFTGRVEDMNELHMSIVSQNLEDGKNDMTVITAVCGMGGVGKTSLTIHYAWTFFKVFYTSVIWINSETKNTVVDSFNRLAQKLGQNISAEFCDVVSGIYENIGKTKSLIIFDNVECYEHVKSYIPIRTPNAMRPYVLLTSRRRNWHFRTHLIDLNVFRTEESVEFFKSYLCLTTEDELEQAKLISVAIQNLPLAIRQAGAYIKIQQQENRKPIVACLKSYLDLFKSNSVELLKFDHSSHTADIYEKTIFSTWTVNIEKLTKKNKLTRTIFELISYLNPDNIPIKLFYCIPQRFQLRFSNPLFRQSCVEITQVDSAFKLLADFSLIRYVDFECISVHRLLQKVVRAQVKQKYKISQLNCIIDMIEFQLRLNNYDHYDYIYFLHSVSIKEHIPTHLLHTKRVKSFFELIEYKQSNSFSNNLKRLQKLLEEDQVDDALKSYEQSRKLYLAHGASMRKTIAHLFTIGFVELICSHVCGTSTGALELCQIIKNVFRDSSISVNDYLTTEESHIFMNTLKKLCFTIDEMQSAVLIVARKELFSSVCFILRILFGNLETICHHSEFIDICYGAFDCFVKMKEFDEVKIFLDSLCIVLERTLSKQSDSILIELAVLRKAIENFFQKLKYLDLLTVGKEMFVRLSIQQFGVYNYYKNRTDFIDALRCGSSMIECNLKINDALQTLDTVIDIQGVLKCFVSSTDYQDFVDGLNNDDIFLVDQIHEASQHPYCESIKNELTVIAFDMYNLILAGRRQTDHYEAWYAIASSMVDCCTQTDKLSATQIITAVRNSFIYGQGIHMPYTSKCTKMTAKLMSYLSIQKKYNEIVTLVRDYDSYLQNVILPEEVAHPSNVSIAHEIEILGEIADDMEEKKHLSSLAYSIYDRVYIFNSTIHENKISMHLNYSKEGNGHSNVMYCLAKVNKLNELFNFLMACENFFKKEHPIDSAEHIHEITQADLIIKISNHPNCSEVKDELIQKALSICNLGHRKFYYCVDIISRIVDALAELEKADEIMEIIRHIETAVQIRDYCPLESLIAKAIIIYTIAQHKNLNFNRVELLNKSLVFYREYICKLNYKIQESNYDSKGAKDGRIVDHIDDKLVTQGVEGTINCLVELDRSDEIEQFSKDIVNIFREYYWKLDFKTHISCLPEQLLSVGLDSNTPRTKKELIEMSLNLFMILYEFEKRTFHLTSRIFSTLENIVECLIQIDKIDHIELLSVEFQKFVVEYFENEFIKQIKSMAGLCDILMRKGRGANHLIKFPELIAETLTISRKWYEIAVRENGDGDILSLVHFHFITVCEHLVEPNVNKLIEYSQNFCKIVENNKDNPKYAIILFEGATELRYAMQFDKAVEYFEFSCKALSEIGMTYLNYTADIDELERMVRDNDTFQLMISEMFNEEDTSESESNSD